MPERDPYKGEYPHGPYSPSSLPIATLAAVVAILAILGAVVAAVIIFGEPDATTTPFIVSILGIVGATVPALVGAGFAERAAKDIRNGTLVEKAREGAQQALIESPTIQRRVVRDESK